MKTNASMDRRTLLKTAAAAGAATAAGVLDLKAPFVMTARAEEAIKLGVLLPKSGPYTVQGENGHNGAQVAVDDFNGHVLDRPIQIVWLDEPNPQTTQQNMHKLVEEEKVVAVQGGISSGDVLAIMPIAERAKILLMATGPNATEITGKNCNRYTFRVDLPNKVTVNTVYPSLKEYGKKWYFVSASYAWGIDAYNQMKDVLVKDGGTVLGFDQAPLGTTDFSSYILKLRQANPDVVYVGIGGADLTNFLKQLHEIGMTRKMPLSSPIINDFGLVGGRTRSRVRHLSEAVELHRRAQHAAQPAIRQDLSAEERPAARGGGVAGLVRHHRDPHRDQGDEVHRFQDSSSVSSNSTSSRATRICRSFSATSTIS